MIPNSTNWNNDLPIALNERHVKITFEDGEDVMFHAGKLYLIGKSIDKIVVTSGFQIVCGSDPKCEQLKLDKDGSLCVEDYDYSLNQYTLKKLDIGTPLLEV